MHRLYVSYPPTWLRGSCFCRFSMMRGASSRPCVSSADSGAVDSHILTLSLSVAAVMLSFSQAWMSAAAATGQQ
jgi:hypothetical protein